MRHSFPRRVDFEKVEYFVLGDLWVKLMVICEMGENTTKTRGGEVRI